MHHHHKDDAKALAVIDEGNARGLFRRHGHFPIRPVCFGAAPATNIVRSSRHRKSPRRKTAPYR
jgi:hypothetical protein